MIKLLEDGVKFTVFDSKDVKQDYLKERRAFKKERKAAYERYLGHKAREKKEDEERK